LNRQSATFNLQSAIPEHAPLRVKNVSVSLTVKVPSAVIDEMLAHAREELPNECCGLIVGRRGVVDSVIRARNVDAAPTRYLIDPQDHFAAMKTARARNLHVIGAYHSHPAGIPAPSPSDIAEASGGRDFLYVIVSPATGEAGGYFFRNGEVVLAELV
jgi:proteasome lid subunit RPN8/RPN11